MSVNDQEDRSEEGSEAPAVPPRAPKRRRDSALARTAVLDAALKRFSAHGYVGARIADIATDAGYSEALVYFHFQSKAGLFREVVARIDAGSRWFEEEGTPESFVAQMREGELRYHLDARWRALDHVWAEALGGERDLLDLIGPQLRSSVGALEALLARFDRGTHSDRRQRALLLLAVSYGARVLRRYDPDAVSPEEAADLLAFTARAVLKDLAREGRS
ncbi:MAG: TetR family transcriptional regulator [Myxococcota bacterium]